MPAGHSRTIALRSLPTESTPILPGWCLESLEKSSNLCRVVEVQSGNPFCGSGTVLLEAMTHGFPSQGTDLNPFACLLARAKTQTTKAVELRRWTDLLVSRLRGQTADAARKSYRPNLEDFTLDVTVVGPCSDP